MHGWEPSSWEGLAWLRGALDQRGYRLQLLMFVAAMGGAPSIGLMASGGPEIIAKLAEHAGQVDLLVTDYAMPDMQGRELAEHVRQRFPAVKVLYQTGFSDMLFENRAELEEGAAFLEKPFTARGLREAARLVLFGSINP